MFAKKSEGGITVWVLAADFHSKLYWKALIEKKQEVRDK